MNVSSFYKKKKKKKLTEKNKSGLRDHHESWVMSFFKVHSNASCKKKSSTFMLVQFS